MPYLSLSIEILHKNQHKHRNNDSLTISVLIEQGEGFLELSNLLFGQLISHCVVLFSCDIRLSFVVAVLLIWQLLRAVLRVCRAFFKNHCLALKERHSNADDCCALRTGLPCVHSAGRFEVFPPFVAVVAVAVVAVAVVVVGVLPIRRWLAGTALPRRVVDIFSILSATKER